jgi:hypothetical protein
VSGIPAIFITAILAVMVVAGVAAFVEITPALAAVFTAAITVIGQIAVKQSESSK